jgi:hypothetical protein
MMRKQGAVCAANLTAILCMGLALAGCQYLRNALGVTKSPPNEFAVTTQPSLALPPDLNLRPPQAGAAPRYALPASEQAKRVVFSATAPVREAMADRAYSEGEMFLLVQAIAVNVDPGIRRTILAETKLYDKAPKIPEKSLPPPAVRLHVANFANTAKFADIGAPQSDETTGALGAIASEMPMPQVDDAKPTKVASNLDAPRKARVKIAPKASIARSSQSLFLRPAFDR